MAYIVKKKSEVGSRSWYFESIEEARAKFENELFLPRQGWIAYDTTLLLQNDIDSPSLSESAYYNSTTGVIERTSIEVKKRKFGRR